MGLLNKKSRIVDTHVTSEGRNQISAGTFSVSYVSFTDDSVDYAIENFISGSHEVQHLVGFEAASNSINDKITFESDDSGRLVDYFSGPARLIAGRIFEGNPTDLNNMVSETFEDGNAVFATAVNNILTSSIDAFKNNSFLLLDRLDEGNKFSFSKDKHEFIITNSSPRFKGGIKEIFLGATEPLFTDRRVSHAPNFMFMPPLLEERYQSEQINDFVNINENPVLKFEDLLRDLSDKPSANIEFVENSNNSNIVAQIFEIVASETSTPMIKKLDVIDFGQFLQDGETKQVYFAGKVFTDEFGFSTYINLFTIIFNE